MPATSAAEPRPGAAERTALGDALAVWRATRSAAIADAIDQTGEAALTGWAAPVARANQAFHAAWLATVGDEAARGWAARTVLQQLPGSDGDRRSAACCERLAALRGAPGDPRIGRAVVELIGQQLQILGYPDVLDAIVGVLAVHGDERTAAIARRRLETADAIDAHVIRRVLAAQPAGQRPVTRDELERFAVRSARGIDRDRLDALLREVHAQPDADEIRLVLADALLEHGDPRGELIALQLAGAADERQLDRIDQLLREHGKGWLGSLREITYRARFARGFLTRLELNGRWTATEQGWARHTADPMLATVEDLIPGRSVGQTYAQFVTSPAMTALRRIEVFDKATLEALRATSAKLVHVSCPRWKVGRYVPQLAASVLPACERFSTLRSFGVHVDGFPHVRASMLFEQLTSITVAGGLRSGLALWPSLPRTMSLTIARSAMLEDCATTRVAWAGALTLAREGAHAIARVSGDWLVSELVESFDLLPPELNRIELEGAGEPTALTAIAGRREIELLVLPVARRTGCIAGLNK